MSLNKVMLIGNSGKKPDYKQFENGGRVAQFSIATTKKGYTAKDGTVIPDKTEWHNIVLQNGLADVANNYINKGTKVYIEGELRTRSYQDAQGITRYITEVYGYSMELLTPRATEIRHLHRSRKRHQVTGIITQMTIYHFKKGGLLWQSMNRMIYIRR